MSTPNPATVEPMPGGRPSSIDAVIEHTPEGVPVTVADRIIALLRQGAYMEHAAAAAGVQKVTVYDWLRTGARAGMAVEKGKKITPEQARCREFANAVHQASGQWVAEANLRLSQAARGGRTLTTTTTKRDASGGVIETTERTEIVPPNPSVDQWRLERRLPALYGRRVVELTGPDGGAIPVEVRARELAETIRSARAAAENARVNAPNARANVENARAIDAPAKPARARKSRAKNEE